jgi:hypothetical protein
MVLETSAEGRERRVYTDERLPFLEVHNDGDSRFIVYENGQPFDQFAALEDLGALKTSEVFAQRRAQEYLERMVEQEVPRARVPLAETIQRALDAALAQHSVPEQVVAALLRL